MMLYDDMKQGIGLGILLMDLRFKHSIENRHDSSLGYRLKMRAEWKSLYGNDGQIFQMEYIQAFLSHWDIELKEHYYNIMSIQKLITLIDKLDSEYKTALAFADQGGLAMARWLIDNPLPNTWDEMVEWGKCYDDEREAVSMLNFDDGSI